MDNFVDKGINVAYLEISVLSAQIPSSFYLVTTSNNSLIINTTTYSIPVGNYNINSLCTALRALLPSTFTVSYSSITGKITLTNNVYFYVSHSSTAFEILGLSKVMDSTATFITPNYVCVFPNMVNLYPLQQINVWIPEFQLRNFGSHIQCLGPMIAAVPNTSPQGGMISYQNRDARFMLQSLDVQTFQVKLQDDTNQFIDFNGHHWNLVLQLDTTYDAFERRLPLDLSETLAAETRKRPLEVDDAEEPAPDPMQTDDVLKTGY